MSTLTAAALGAVGGWFATKAAKARKRSKDRGSSKNATVDATPDRSDSDEVLLEPPSGPRVGAKYFLFRWLGVFVSRLRPDPATDEHMHPPVKPAPSLSVRLAGVVNLINRPLFVGGILLLVWLLVDAALLLLVPTQRHTLRPYTGLAVTVLGPACVGYWTNWLAIKMLFHPRKKNAVWQGLVPGRRDELVETIADGVLQRLISPEIVRQYLEDSDAIGTIIRKLSSATQATIDDPEFREELNSLIYQRVYAFCASPQVRREAENAVARILASWTGGGFKGKVMQATKKLWAPQAAKLVGDVLPEVPNALDSIFARLDTELGKLPGLVERHREQIERGVYIAVEQALENLDIRSVVTKQLGDMDDAELEGMLTGGVSREIVFIQTAGGLLGAMVGCAIAFPIARPVLIGLALVLVVAYFMTVQRGDRAMSADGRETSRDRHAGLGTGT
ncbi:MAG: DUF445 domain-containing protein [bacterium]